MSAAETVIVLRVTVRSDGVDQSAPAPHAFAEEAYRRLAGWAYDSSFIGQNVVTGVELVEEGES